ncbi:lysylphosphatidylglycerol synthase transmembrane domain-containing protein [Agriterribacter sp.]|uniref:lysylphosphatidylglycerol synthase transmembrane domain-containing protein n=1 Tax=Agriterribacter sp. TaxID=2821509 RepID=UPI002CE03D7B|nr:lysylphosphatidylglycerol synthase transmembrane domain-containing protein [Agriterribacter sp.]HTN06404.1 lysylphosphatidylglycerol synthase transmembrane domain-containing protein [Agriterribacter sp.]
MRKKTANALQYTLFLGLGVFLLWLSAHHLSPENRQHLMAALYNANYWLVVPAMLLLMISHYSRALRWRILIRPLGYRPSVIHTFFATILGYFFNLLVPRLGEVMKCTILAKHEKIPADKLIGTMVTERVCDFLCLLIIIVITIFIQFDIIHQYASAQFHSLLYDAQGQFKMYKMAIIIGFLAAIIALLFWLASIFATSRFIQTIKKLLKGVWVGIASIKHMENKGLFLFHTFFIWTMYLLSIRIGLYTMEAVSHLGFKACFAILSFGSIAMLATQGGIGAYQYTIQKLLPLYGVAEGPALGFGWILWIAQTGIIIFAGIVCLLLLPIINRGKYEIPSVDQ